MYRIIHFRKSFFKERIFYFYVLTPNAPQAAAGRGFNVLIFAYRFNV